MLIQSSKTLEKKSPQKELSYLSSNLEKIFPTSQIKIKQIFKANKLIICISFVENDHKKNSEIFYNLIQVYVGKIWSTSSKLTVIYHNMEGIIVLDEPFSSTYLGKINEDRYVQLERKSFQDLNEYKDINNITLVIENIEVSNTLIEYFKDNYSTSNYRNIINSIKSILVTQKPTINGLSIEKLNKHLALNYLIYQYKDFIQSISTELRNDNHISAFYTLSKTDDSVIGIPIKKENNNETSINNLISHLIKKIFDHNLFSNDEEDELRLYSSNSTNDYHYLAISELYSSISKRKKENSLPFKTEILNNDSYKIQIINEDEYCKKYLLLILRSIVLYFSIRNSGKIVITLTNRLESFDVDITKLNDEDELSKIYKMNNCITIETYVNKKNNSSSVQYNSNSSANILQNSKERSFYENIFIENKQYLKEIKQKLLLVSVIGVILFFIYFIPSKLFSSYIDQKKLYILLPLITTSIILMYTAYELNKFNTQVIEPIFHEFKINSEYKL